MNASKLTTAVMVVAMLTVAMVPATVGAASAEATVDIGVTQDAETGNATVTVVQNQSAVENATVVVESNESYSGNGTYETDANGTVELPNPQEQVNVSITATVDNNSTTESATLVPLNESLDVSAEADDANDTVTATVTQYGEAVENATVQVNGTDFDNATYETDANGTVSFDEPANETTLTIVATSDNLSAETTLTAGGDNLSIGVSQDENATVTISVTEDGEAVENATVTVTGNYTDAGEYQTDENGTVELSAPLQNVTVNVTAEHDGLTAETTVTLQGEVSEDDPFGSLVSNFVERLKQAGVDGPMGQAVSDFVTENNPGKADEKRPDHAGKSDKAPGKSKNASDTERGPPEHAKNGADKADDDAEEESEETTEDDSEEETEDGETDDDTSNGPPDHANNDK
ncbi:hypothetical protein ACH9L7_03765 [Haloferax sp. S1W]|uniref:hypothetical protein n=1 Tax=Haloferax sp. S1W TaxID=3377110 RepID=UPI0037C71E9C